MKKILYWILKFFGLIKSSEESKKAEDTIYELKSIMSPYEGRKNF